jgi:signal transduction histidine kinase
MSKNQMNHDPTEFQLYDLLPLGVCAIDDTLTVHGWNQRFVDWTGLSRDSAIGMNLGEEYPHLLLDRYNKRLQHMFATTTPVVFTAALHKFFIPICLGASDDMMVQHTLVRPIPDGSGRALVIVEDVTSQILQQNKLRQERIRLRQSESELAERAEELARSNSELEQFAYVTSHDLKEPLRMVAGYTQLLADDYADRLDDDARKYIHYATDGASRMQRLIDDLLNFSRIGRKDGDLVQVDLQNVVEAALLNLRASIDQHSARIDVDALPTVLANEAAMTRLFQNFIGNALKFRGGGPPHIRVNCQLEGGQFHLTIEDNGIGIEPEFHERVFGVFQRLHTRQEYEGTGIGLAICKKVVEQHGGRIWVESEPGSGTVFHFTLPNHGESALQPTRQEVQSV